MSDHSLMEKLLHEEELRKQPRRIPVTEVHPIKLQYRVMGHTSKVARLQRSLLDHQSSSVSMETSISDQETTSSLTTASLVSASTPLTGSMPGLVEAQPAKNRLRIAADKPVTTRFWKMETIGPLCECHKNVILQSQKCKKQKGVTNRAR